MTPRKITDWTLVPLFLQTLWSGIKLHVAEYHAAHNEWHAWAVTHSIAGVLMAAFIIIHIAQHWGWYMALNKPLKIRKARVRRLNVAALTVLFAALIFSGLWLLLMVDGGTSHLGLVHFWIGAIASIFAIAHILRRHRQFLGRGTR